MTKLEQMIAGLGGPENIVELEPCITRLRIEVEDPKALDLETLRDSGCHGIMNHGNGIQVVVGPQAELIAEELSELIWGSEIESDGQ
ncbi:PTS sugar transporter [Boudabousia liubingyangii]|uniref:PTS sugar transporter n=1 Tax=Boudabousia liubingyangii TaxID=1921764 RepID=A0A1Q5PMQ4_9ACTO|nr:PTS glucose/sucrose transporter subunit IIB [Boudabousia liubingyangii]OKL47428.1 PTS sugar transporter [Boudabousia liubingyangii]OKL48799.1 PTS sugar transporter [Boudabousia liubingyangii]